MRVFRALLLLGGLLAVPPWVFAAPSRQSVAILADPFYSGPGMQASFLDREDNLGPYRQAQLKTSYGFSSGTALSLNLPVILNDATGLSIPRLGGGLTSRLELDAEFRLWGNAYDYFALLVGMGFPLQTDLSLKKSSIASWLAPFSLEGRWDADWIAFRLNLSDDINYPTTSPASAGSRVFLDTTNLIFFSLTLSFLSHGSYAPYLSWFEAFPRTVDVATDTGTSAFLLRQAGGPRSRSFTLGIEATPLPEPAMFTLETSLNPLADNSMSALSVQGKLRWQF